LPRVARGLQRRGREIMLVWGLSKRVKAEHGSDWGFRNFLADWRLKAWVFTLGYRRVK
jgi:hypothetical protein